MTKQTKSLRTPQGQVSGLGSAKHGVEHWWRQRVTAIALILLSVYLMTTFVMNVVFGTYDDTLEWLSSPFVATLMILFIVVGFYHAALGLQVIIEDYVHTDGLKIVSVLAVKFSCVAFAVLGILSLLKIVFGSALPHA